MTSSSIAAMSSFELSRNSIVESNILYPTIVRLFIDYTDIYLSYHRDSGARFACTVNLQLIPTDSVQINHIDHLSTKK